jgi:hypothetical protein
VGQDLRHHDEQLRLHWRGRMRELSARQDLLAGERVRLHDECRLPDG